MKMPLGKPVASMTVWVAGHGDEGDGLGDGDLLFVDAGPDVDDVARGGGSDGGADGLLAAQVALGLDAEGGGGGERGGGESENSAAREENARAVRNRE